MFVQYSRECVRSLQKASGVDYETLRMGLPYLCTQSCLTTTQSLPRSQSRSACLYLSCDACSHRCLLKIPDSWASKSEWLVSHPGQGYEPQRSLATPQSVSETIVILNVCRLQRSQHNFCYLACGAEWKDAEMFGKVTRIIRY